MPIPIVGWALVTGAATIAAAVAAAAAGRAWSKKTRAVKEEGGKVVAILGPRRVGKTSLARFIAEDVDLPIPYEPTKIPRDQSYEKDINGKPWMLRLVDFGGSPEQVRDWRKSAYAAETEVIWFLVSAEGLLEDGARQVTVDLARAVADDNWRQRRFLVVTHADLDANFDGDREESLTAADEVQRLRMILGAEVTVIGSLESREHARWLADALVGATQA